MTEDRGSVRAGELSDVLAEEVAAGGGGHPSDDDLLGYRDGSLDGGAETTLRDHLLACRECTERLLDLDALSPGSGTEADSESEIEAAAAWRELRASLAAERVGASGWAGATGGGRALRSLAAVLALAVVGLGLWVGQLRREVDRLAAPQANLPILYLDEPARDVDAAVPEVAAPGAEGRVLLIVTPPPDGERAEYRAVVAAEGGREIWSVSGLRPSDAGTLRVLLPRRRLPSGRYDLRLSRLAGGASQEVARYRFTVLPEARGPLP